MKNSKKLKLNNLNSQRLKNVEMSATTGGQSTEACCGCACAYEGNGGSSSVDNAQANFNKSVTSKGEIQLWHCGD